MQALSYIVLLNARRHAFGTSLPRFRILRKSLLYDAFESALTELISEPDAEAVEAALHQWVRRAVANRKGVVRVGYFGSYARGDSEVGSDLDLLIVVENSSQPFERRSVDWDTTEPPVPVDALVYTRDEWDSLSKEGRFHQTLAREIVWVYERQKPRTSQ
ncbi:MAG: nucleotidyltransferase domain-containing protein [Deltaproteobacteria bacterium]|nr:nucleotidyltransferase domain-containing protein [Deltaproteobacteria bacterium]